MKKELLVLAFSGLVFLGCATPYSEAPLATNFNNSEQKELQAASHWQVIAEHLSKSIIENVGTKKLVYVNEPAENSKFNHALHAFLLSELVKNGMNVSKTPMIANVKIDIATQVLVFSPDRAQFRNSAGVPTLLAAGVWTLIGVNAANTAATTVGVGVTGAAVGLDAYNWFGSKYASGAIPQHEIIVTVTASDVNTYLSSVNNVYYIADSDASLYRSFAKGVRLSIVGDKE